MLRFLSIHVTFHVLTFLMMLFEDPQIFKPTGRYATASVPEFKLEMWTASWCPNCPQAIAEATAAANDLGTTLTLIDYDQNRSVLSAAGITAPPTLCIVSNNRIHERIPGGAKRADVVAKVRDWQRRWAAPVPQHNQQSSPVLIPPATPLPEVSYANPISDNGRYVSYGGRQYDMTTWRRQCNLKRCDMCNYLDQMQANYLANHQTSVPSPQAPSPDEVIDEALAEMKLTPSDVVAELGSGDGTPAIRMARETGCRVVGCEIDPAKVAESRAKVAAAGLTDKITIVEGDVLDFDPKKYGATAVYAYLDPLLLGQITPALSAGRITVCPGHKAPGLDMSLVGQLWVRR